MAPYQLYCFAESGNSYKAALMLALSGARWDPIWVDYFGGETRQPKFRTEVSVMGEVPVLLHNGERIAALPGWKAPYDLMPRGPARAVPG